MENTITNQDNYRSLMDFKKRLATAKEEAEKVKTARITGEATIKQLKKNEQEIVDKIKALGYEPDNIKDTITTMMTNLDSILKIIENATPDENGKIPAGVVENMKAKLAGTPAVTVEEVKAVAVEEPVDEAWSF